MTLCNRVQPGVQSQLVSTAEQDAHGILKQQVIANAEKPLPHMWDNWVLMSIPNGVIRCTLEAPSSLQPDDRHTHSRIGIYFDNLKGNLQKLDLLPDTPPCWSGSAEVISGADTIKAEQDPASVYKSLSYKLYYTALPDENTMAKTGLYRPQRIAIAHKNAGENHVQPEKNAIHFYETYSNGQSAVLNSKYYHLGESRHIISACRDPFVFQKEGQYHMLFAARYSEAHFESMPQALQQQLQDCRQKVSGTVENQHEVNSAIGYATSIDGEEWHVQKPIPLPVTAVQLELPSLVQTPKADYLLAIISDGNVSIENRETGDAIFGPRTQRLVCFGRDNTEHGNYTHAGGWKEIDLNRDKTPYSLDYLYGMAFKFDPDKNKVAVCAFEDKALKMTKVLYLDVDRFPYNIPHNRDAVWIQAYVSALYRYSEN